MVALVLAIVITIISGVSVLTGCDNGFTNSRKPVPGPIIDGKEAFHVIVAGGEPEGVAAALAAARNGLRTLLIEEGEALGGLMTMGMLNFLDMNHGPDHELLTRGIFQEFNNALGNAFDVEEAKEWFMKKCQNEPKLTVLLNTKIVSPIMSGNTISGLEILEQGSSSLTTHRSLVVIDATVDGDVAAAAGAPYTFGGEDYGAHGLQQGVTLVFEVSGVDWDAVYNYLRNDDNPSTGADNVAAWGYGQEAKDYVTLDGNMRYRGPNIAKQKNGNVLLNALIIFGVDPLDPDSYAEGIARGVREIPNIIEFMRGHFTGFENAEYASHAPRLYVRETRHFIGEYRLTITDVLENRDHWDRIGHGSYPVDLQPKGPDDWGSIIGVPDIYSIPFRCLVPLKIDQLLIASRCASYDSLPHGSTRVIPIGMVVGEACGTAAAYSVGHGVTFRQMAYDLDAIVWIQEQLTKQGAYVNEYAAPRMAVMDHWAYPGVVIMRSLALAMGGYDNDYRLDNELSSRWTLQNSINRMMKVINERTERLGEFQIPAWEVSVETDEITVGQLLLLVAECASLGDRDWLLAENVKPDGLPITKKFGSADISRDYLIELGVLDTSVLDHYKNLDAIATVGQLQSTLGALYTFLMSR